MVSHVPSAPAVDLGLIEKYNLAGPRYTSYPTAARFSSDVPADELIEALRRDNADPARPLSLYFHIPFCRSLCWYCGCTNIITRRTHAGTEYVSYLEKEIALTGLLLNSQRRVTQLHFGGGTPTFLEPADILRLGEAIRRQFSFDEQAECSVEIDPRHLTREQVSAYRKIGCNRASLGVQDTDPTVQSSIHRLQPLSVVQEAVKRLRAEGFDSLSFDLIYGLPRQTSATFRRTLEDVLALRPDRLSLFSYAHVPWLKPAQRVFDQQGSLPSTHEKLALFAMAVEQLTSAGYESIGMDHFALPRDELAAAARTGGLHRNFQGYSTRAGASLCAFGMSAISQTPDSYRQNHKLMADYRAALDADRLPIERGLLPDRDDLRRREIIMDLMCRHSLDYADLSARLGVDVQHTYAAELASLTDLEADGLLRRHAGGLEVTKAGRLLVRVIAMRFDAHLDAAPRRYSRTI